MSAILPKLYVEGSDDISVVSALLRRHGVETAGGSRYLEIRDLKSVGELLAAMPDAIRDATAYTVGFLVDIDIECTSRWSAIRSRLKEIGISSPTECPSTGFFGKLPDYPHRFGVWLMPDCKTDGQKLEDLLATLIPAHDPLWVHAQKSTQDAAEIVDEVNASGAKKWTRFSDTDWIKAVMRAWLAWQREPGVQLGAAINDHILHADSPEAIAFLKWVKALFEFPNLSV